MNRTLYIPASDETEAREIGRSIAAGLTGQREHYEAPASAQAVADHLNRMAECQGRAIRRSVFPVTLRTVDDGRLISVWPTDRVGDVAATLTIFAMIPLVGIASLWERVV